MQNIDVFNKFPIEFLSNLSFILRKKIFAINEHLIDEYEAGDEIFFIQSGRVSVIHKRSKTHITELDKDSYVGEIGFFSEEIPR
jgi:CRP-like cAMP-binding protein